MVVLAEPAQEATRRRESRRTGPLDHAVVALHIRPFLAGVHDGARLVDRRRTSRDRAATGRPRRLRTRRRHGVGDHVGRATGRDEAPADDAKNQRRLGAVGPSGPGRRRHHGVGRDHTVSAVARPGHRAAAERPHRRVVRRRLRVGTLLVIGLLALLAGGAGVAAWRRSHRA